MLIRCLQVLKLVAEYAGVIMGMCPRMQIPNFGETSQYYSQCGLNDLHFCLWHSAKFKVVFHKLHVFWIMFILIYFLCIFSDTIPYRDLIKCKALLLVYSSIFRQIPKHSTLYRKLHFCDWIQLFHLYFL